MPKGGKQPGAGRPAGVANKATTNAREAIALFIEGNVGRLNEWLDRIADESPEKAFNCVRDLMEYHVPKLARTEVQPLDADGNKSGGFEIIVKHVKANAKD